VHLTLLEGPESRQAMRHANYLLAVSAMDHRSSARRTRNLVRTSFLLNAPSK
jgi:hypothetical protein